MKHNNISIFIPHLGCPNMCSFCNQHSISGATSAPTPKEVYETCLNAFKEIKNKNETEIAFFGGSFTAINREYMISLLEIVQQFIGKDKFSGIRISTRPDCINNEILKLLKYYNVRSIELGVQSTDNDVLYANDRGHTKEDVISACKLIKQYNFQLGIQMMVGLYMSSPEKDMKTCEEIISLKPDVVRVYPVVILKDTKLAKLYMNGQYIPYSLDDAVKLSSKILIKFQNNNINVIRLGLHSSELVENQMVGGLYHPAFKELCENYIFRELIENSLTSDYKNYIIYVSNNCISKAVGQNKSNIEYFIKKGVSIKIKPNDNITGYNIKIKKDV